MLGSARVSQGQAGLTYVYAFPDTQLSQLGDWRSHYGVLRGATGPDPTRRVVSPDSAGKLGFKFVQTGYVCHFDFPPEQSFGAWYFYQAVVKPLSAPTTKKSQKSSQEIPPLPSLRSRLP